MVFIDISYDSLAEKRIHNRRYIISLKEIMHDKEATVQGEGKYLYRGIFPVVYATPGLFLALGGSSWILDFLDKAADCCTRRQQKLYRELFYNLLLFMYACKGTFLFVLPHCLCRTPCRLPYHDCKGKRGQ